MFDFIIKYNVVLNIIFNLSNDETYYLYTCYVQVTHIIEKNMF